MISNFGLPRAFGGGPAGLLKALRRRLPGRSLVIGGPFLWLIVFFLIPFFIVLKISFSTLADSVPPFAPFTSWTDDGALQFTLHFDSYQYLGSDSLYLVAYLSSIRNAFVTTVLCLLIGYPMAYAIARAKPTLRPVFLMLIIMPFWTSFLIRVYAWIGILKENGILNGVLMWLGVIHEPLQIMNTQSAVYIGMAYAYLPFMVLPLYSTLEKMDISLIEAANDLGARPIRTFWSITLPLSLPGIIAGSLLVFIPAVGEFIIPEVLGSSQTIMIATVLWNEFFLNRDWPTASAVTVVMVALLLVPMALFQKIRNSEQAK